MVTLPALTSTGRMRQKSAYAIQHLMAAATFSRQCGKAQEENIGKPLGAFYDEQVACVSAAVMLSVASIESYINELLSDCKIIFPEMTDSQSTEFVELISSLSILQKYEKVIAVKNLDPFKKGESPYQDVDILISMRNELVHFHPEWHDEQIRHDRLGKKLQYRFELSPFISEGLGVLFPQRIISHGCTNWAVTKSLEFMISFTEKVGLPNKFEKFKERLDV